MTKATLKAEDLDMFFEQLRQLEHNYMHWVGETPKTLRISPEFIGRLARVPGFYERPELQAEVTVHSPIVRKLKLEHAVVTIRDDYHEKFMHLE